MEEEIKKGEEVVKKEDVGKVDPYIARLVVPHTKISREVKEEDLDKLVEESKVLYQLCYTQNGLYTGAYAMHHSQIDDKDPMDFFVVGDKSIIINPKIIKHSNYTKGSTEQCMSFSDKMPVVVQRWQKIEVTYQTIMTDPEKEGKFKLSSVINDSLSGFIAIVFQHEIDHSNAKFIYQLK